MHSVKEADRNLRLRLLERRALARQEENPDWANLTDSVFLVR